MRRRVEYPSRATRRNPNRWLALGLFLVFVASLVGHFMNPGSWHRQPEQPLALLPAAIANPAEVAVADTLHAGETLSQLLVRAQLAEEESRALLSALREFQDPRRLLPGSVVSYRRSYVNGLVRQMEFKLDPDHTLSMRRRDLGWSGMVEQVPVRPDTVVLSGEINSSLYAALIRGQGEGVPAEERERVVDLLADKIFAWQIDFSRDLRKGDRFRVLYERMVRPDGSARSGRIVSAELSVDRREYSAYLFEAPDGTVDYYDREGESLRRAFLRAPLAFRRISSSYSKSRFHPILKRNRPHHGIDYSASSGTPVRSVGDGVVRRAGRGGGYGNVVEVRHKRGYSSRYAHLKGFAPGVRSGTRVKQGDIIGYVGSTGLSTAPHLHYEFHSDGRPIDPNSIRYILGDPVPSRYRSQFQAVVAHQIAALDRVTAPVMLAANRSSEPMQEPGD